MLVALSVIGVKPGDEIIAYQPFATQNLKVVWADIDPKTGTLSPASVKSKITSETKAIFHNHYCGYLGYINEIGKEKGIVVVDDAIEAFGSEYKGKRMGNIGTDMTISSFQQCDYLIRLKVGQLLLITMIFTKKALLIRDYGIDRSKFRDEMGEICSKCDISLPGYGATLSDVNSNIGVLQMQKIEELIQRQRQNAEYWEPIIQSKISNYEFVNANSDQNPNYWVFGLLSSDKIELIRQFRKEGFYASGVHLPNTYYSAFGTYKSLSGVNEFYSKFVAIPCGWWLKAGERNLIGDTLKKGW